MMPVSLYQMAHKNKRLLYSTWKFSVKLILSNMKKREKEKNTVSIYLNCTSQKSIEKW